MDHFYLTILPLAAAWCLDLALGDPAWLPHLIVGFGKTIAFFEHRLNRGGNRKLKGAVMAATLIAATFVSTWYLLDILSPWPWIKIVAESILIFYCIAGTTLISEVKMVFIAVDRSIDEGRRQVSRIVGRDTAQLSAQEIRTAALETLAENLSDGVIAPLFWYALLGAPGMVAYKMINTLDSMIGYRNARYKDYGCMAAHIDDIANYIPARLTALLMALAAGRPSVMGFVARYGSKHASPNSGYPEAALAGILDCRFGGTHDYFGESVEKPYIGENDRQLTTADMEIAIHVNRVAECMAVVLAGAVRFLLPL